MAKNVTLSTSDSSPALFDSLKKLQKRQVYVGIPEANSTDREATLLGMAGKSKGKKARRLAVAASQDVTNAGLLFIHTNGSPLKHIPARPVLEPAIEANKDSITFELGKAAKDVLEDRDPTANLQRAGLQGQNAARKWFTDPRNAWAPNAPSTIRRKGSDRPLISTGAMRAAITSVVGTED